MAQLETCGVPAPCSGACALSEEEDGKEEEEASGGFTTFSDYEPVLPIIHGNNAATINKSKDAFAEHATLEDTMEVRGCCFDATKTPGKCG
jgi:hypothetical protein